MKRKRKPCRSTKKEQRALLWATATTGAVELPDARLAQRAVAILAAKAARPGDSIPQGAPSPAAAKATYRFMENERVTPEPLWKAIHEHTAKGFPSVPRVVSVQDTVCLMFPGLKCTPGLGTADRPVEEALWMHSALALRPDGHVLGLLHNHVWARPLSEFGKGHQAKKRPFEEKESFEWVRGLRHVRGLRDRFSPHTSILTVADSAGDVHEVLAEVTARPGDDAIIRASQDRRVADDYASVRAQLAAQKPLDRLKLDVPRKQGQRKRKAWVELRALRVTVLPPQNSRGLHPVAIHVLWVREPRPPKGVEALDWLLFTTLPIATAADRAEVVRLYKLRWRIEEFHLALKGGCQVEKTQLKTAERIQRLLPFFCATAARLVQLTDWAGSPGSGVGGRAPGDWRRPRLARFLSPCLPAIEAEGGRRLEEPLAKWIAYTRSLPPGNASLSTPPFRLVTRPRCKKACQSGAAVRPASPAHPHRIPESHWARSEPNAACTVALSDLEWRVAWQFTHRARVPAGTPTPTIAEAVRMIGRMGGHLGRKGDGMPGLRSLWKGWRDLQLLVDYHQTFR